MACPPGNSLKKGVHTAAAFLYLDDVTTSVTSHWMAAVGVIFMVFVLLFPRGVWGSALHGLRRRGLGTRRAG